jgi:hypothetical protein
MKAPHKIGIPPGMRVLYFERHPVTGHYRLWLHTNDRILGTYLALWDNGKIERITVRADEGDQIDLIKKED